MGFRDIQVGKKYLIVANHPSHPQVTVKIKEITDDNGYSRKLKIIDFATGREGEAFETVFHPPAHRLDYIIHAVEVL